MKWPEPDPDAYGIPASTVVAFRRSTDGGAPEILMVIRSKAMNFVGGAAVFPGGKVDPADVELAKALYPDLDEGDVAARIAGVREMLEETGLVIGIHRKVTPDEVAQARELVMAEKALAPVLEKMGWQLALDQLVLFSRWHPKVKAPRIFDARFYLVDLGTGNVEIAVDETENTHLFWVTASEALAMADRGELSIIFPTRRNLERLAMYASFDEARSHSESINVDTITPWVDRTGERPVLRIRDDQGYPVTFEPIESVIRAIPTS